MEVESVRTSNYADIQNAMSLTRCNVAYFKNCSYSRIAMKDLNNDSLQENKIFINKRYCSHI